MCRMEHMGIVVEDLPAAIAFFTALGLERKGEGSVSGESVDRIVALEDVHSDFAMLGTPDGSGRIELIKFNAPAVRDGDSHAPPNTLGLRHLAFEVDDIRGTVERLGAELVGEIVNYGDSYHLCYLRGPEGIIVELAQKVR